MDWEEILQANLVFRLRDDLRRAGCCRMLWMQETDDVGIVDVVVDFRNILILHEVYGDADVEGSIMNDDDAVKGVE
jgi:hypothetical protein